MRTIVPLVVLLLACSSLLYAPSRPVAGELVYERDMGQDRIVSAKYFGQDFLVAREDRVEIIDRAGNVLWTHQSDGLIHDVTPYNGSNILISNTSSNTVNHVIEIDRDTHNHLYEATWPPGSWMSSIRALPNGNIAGVDADTDGVTYFGEYELLGWSSMAYPWREGPYSEVGDCWKIEPERYLYAETGAHQVGIENDSWTFGSGQGNDTTHLDGPSSAVVMAGSSGSGDLIYVADRENWRIAIVNRTTGLIEDSLRIPAAPIRLDADPANDTILVVTEYDLYEIKLEDYWQPQNWTVEDIWHDDGSRLRITWDPYPGGSLDFDGFEVFVDGSSAGRTSSPTMDLTGLAPGQHPIQIQTLYRTHDPFNLSFSGESIDEIPFNPSFSVGLASDNVWYVDFAGSVSPDVGLYHLYYENASFSDVGSLAPLDSVISPGNRSYIEPDPGTYWIAVTAEDGSAENTSVVARSVEITQAADPEDTPLPSPSNVWAADEPDDAGGAVRVRWEPVLSQYLDHYEVYHSDAYFDNVSSMTPVSIANTTNETTINGLTDNRTYWFAVVPVNHKGVKLTGVTPATAIPLDNRDLIPPDPVSITTSKGNATGENLIWTVEWIPSTDPDFDRYGVYFGSSQVEIGSLTPYSSPDLITSNNISAVYPSFINGTDYFVAVAVFDTSDNYVEPIWAMLDVTIESNGNGNGNGNNDNTTPPDNGNGFGLINILPEIVGLTVSGLIGVLVLSIRRKKMRNLLDEITNIYTGYYNRPTIALEKLSGLKHSLERDLRNNKLNENQFIILEKRIDEHIAILDNLIYHDTFKEPSDLDSYVADEYPSYIKPY